MNVCAKSAALLAMLALGSGALAQSEASAAPFTYTEVTSEHWSLAPTSTAQGMRVQATQWTQAGSHALGLSFGFEAGGSRLRPGFGLRWRSRFSERQWVEMATWRQLQAAHEDALALVDGMASPPLTTRIELGFVPPKGGRLGADFGAIGVQLSSDTKLQLKIRRGGPTIYYRGTF